MTSTSHNSATELQDSVFEAYESPSPIEISTPIRPKRIGWDSPERLASVGTTLSVGGLAGSLCILGLIYLRIATLAHAPPLACVAFFLCLPMSVIGKIVSLLALIERPTWLRGLGMIVGVLSIGLSLVTVAVTVIGAVSANAGG